MEGLSLLKVLQKDHFLRRLDPKHAYISVALQEISQKNVRFRWPGNLYEFLCLCFYPRPAPRIFAKLMKIPTALTRRLNVRLITYLDMVGGSLEEIMISKRHIDFYITESRVCNKLSKIRFQSFSWNSVPAARNRPLNVIVSLPLKCNAKICWTNQIYKGKWPNWNVVFCQQK